MGETASDPSGLHVVAPGDGDGGGFSPQIAEILLDRTAHPFIVIDAEGYLTYAGSSIQELLGWAPAEAVGRHMIEFLAPESLDLAARGLEEINDLDMLAVGVPMVFTLRHREGHNVACEVGAMTLPDLDHFQGIALRLRPWDQQYHFDRFVRSLLAADSLDLVCQHLSSAIAAELQSSGVIVHHGFDGTAFAGAAGVGIPPS